LKHNKDVKAVILRVDSPGGAVSACETIYQEIEDLPQKVVVSFGNVSASGGYYISANADRIFASPMSITGSIGVFMIRLDFRALAKQYGITFDSVETSDLSGSFDPFYPANRRMKDNFANFAERTYIHFKTLVGNGRGMDLDMVETVAQGRVWTGDQAKRIGLVDELGGLERAIAYCQRNYTSGGQATVVSWPPKKSVFDLLSQEGNEDNDLDEVEVPGVFHYFMEPLQEVASKFLPVDNLAVSSSKRMPRISAASGMMLTVDENCAIRCLLQESGYTDILSEIPDGFFD
jgi:protease-4